MKKTISTVAAIAVAFAGLAFIPAKRNNAMEEAVVTTDAEKQEPGCNYKYKTDRSFSECEEKHTPESSDAEEAEVLDKY